MTLKLERSKETELALHALKAMRQGELIEWGRLSQILGMNAQSEGRHHVNQARKILLREHKRNYECVTDVGVKWLTDAETARRTHYCRRRVHRMARRQVRKLETVKDTSELTEFERIKYFAGLAFLGHLETASHQSALRSAEVRAVRAVPPKQDMDSFRGS